jgi:hypothetical protein
MKDLDLWTFVSVFQEMLGWALWPIAIICALATLAFVFVMLRDRGIVARRLLAAEILGVLGGVGAVATMFLVTSSSPADLGGPIDWLVVIAIFAAGGIGTAVGSYAAIGLFSGRVAIARA